MHSTSPITPLRHLIGPLVFALAAPLAQAGGVALFEGPAGAVGNVRVYDELTGAPLGAPAELQGIQLLPIDFVGRTRLEEFLPGRPRRRSDISGASRLALYGQRGSLYRYSRALAGGGAVFGFFRIASDGSVIVLFERGGSGALGLVDPFLPRLCVAPASDALLVATTLAAGGNLYEVDLQGAGAIDRTAALAPQRFLPSGLALTSEAGVASTPSGLLRFVRSQPGDASPVSFAPATTPAYFSGQLVASRNGHWFLTSAGSDAANQLPYAFDVSGPAVAASTQPAAISVAGFEPEASDGPYMAIRDDGQQAAWRIEAGVTREILLAHVQPAPGEQPEVLSATANFLDTLDEIGLAIFRPGGDLHVAVGKSPAGVANAMDAFDTYSVTLPANPAPASFANLSLYSGDATAPFTTQPQSKPRDWVMLPDFSTLLVYDTQPADGKIDAIRPGAGGAQPVVGFLRNLDGLEVTGRWVLADIERSDSGHARELWRFPLSLAQPAALVLSLNSNANYTSFAARRDGWMAFVSHETSNQNTLRRVHLPTGTLQAWNANTLDFGPALGFTQFGSLALTLANPAGGATWPIGALPPAALQTSASTCQLLPAL